MGKRGPAPKPTAIKRIAGTYRPDRSAANEPQPEIPERTPSVPSHLSEAARAEWYRVAKELHGLGLLTRIDVTALAAYCETFATWVEALDKCREMGLIVKSPNGFPIQNPYLSVASQAEKRMRQWLGEFGMTPSSRSRVSVPQAEETVDEYEAFLNSDTVKQRAKRAAAG